MDSFLFQISFNFNFKSYPEVNKSYSEVKKSYSEVKSFLIIPLPDYCLLHTDTEPYLIIIQ